MKDRHKKTRLTVNAKRVNPIKFDPTRTTTLRRAFVGKLRRKFALLRKAIYDLLVVEDALGLKKNLTYNCRPGQIRGADGKCGPGIGVNIPRDEMPQITQEDLTAFLTFASHENVQVPFGHMMASLLRPTQSEFRQERIDAMNDSALEQPILVSRDLYVLDGTHRWIKHWQEDNNKLVPVLIVQLDLYQALDLMRRFPLVKFTANAFCPTGPGGGVDPSCSPSSTFSDHGTTPEEVGDSWSDYGSGFSIKEISKGEVVKAGSTDVNGNRIDAKDVEKYGRIAKALQKVAQTSKSEHSEVWRGIALPVGTDVSSMFPSGKEFTFEGLTATSHDKSIAKNYTDPQYIGEDDSTKVVLKVSQRGGVTGYDNNHGELSGGETILPSGAKYRVQGIHKEGDLHVVTMTNDESARKPAVTKIAPKSSVTSANNPIYADVSQSHVDTIKEVARELAGKKYTGKVSLYGRVNREVYKRSNKGINLSGYKVEAILKDAGITTNERWRFNTTPEQLEAFKAWLKTQVEYYVAGMSDEELWRKFIQEGFKKGAGRAFEDTEPQIGWTETEGAFYKGSKEQFLKSAFGQPESVEKIQLLAARTFEELKGMSADMQTKVGRILVDGLTKGDGPVAIAREMGKQLELSRTRAETIARTELIRAHAEGQLAGMEELGVEEVGVMVEWSTAGDDRVCELCEPMEGVVLKIEEARGMIPRHPNCRCAFVPANVGEPTDEQKRGKRKIAKAVKISASLGRDEFSTAVPVTKERPKSVLPVITNINTPAPTVVYQFSQLLAGARK